MKHPRRLLPSLSVVALLGLSIALNAGERRPERVLPAATAAADTARVIVKFKSAASLLGGTRAQALAARGDAGPQLAGALGLRHGLALVDGRAIGTRTQVVKSGGMRSEALAAKLRADADVEWAEVDQRRFALAAPNDPLYGPGQGSGTPAVGQWYLRAPGGAVTSALDVESAWNVATGSGQVVAVLDSGARYDHPDLAAQLLPGYDFINDVPTANDGDGRDADASDPGDWITTAENASGEFKDCGEADSLWHGTQVAGLIAAHTDNGIGMAGIARDAKVLPVRVLGKCGGFDSDIVAGMRWAAGLSVPGVSAVNPTPARVINMSLGSSGACSTIYRDAVAELAAGTSTVAPAVVVAAAGNDGLAVGVPANCPGVIAVAGVRHTGTKVGYSNLGANVTISAPAGNCVNETGPCLYALLTTADEGFEGPVAPTYTDAYNATIGTSFSSPLVAGTAALMWSANPSLSIAQLTSALKTSARAFPTSGAGAGVAACQAPGSVAQDGECYCTTATCGAGSLDAGGAVARALSGPYTVLGASATSVAAGSTVTLDGSGSTVLIGRTFASYRWEIVEGATLASFSSATNAATATLRGGSEGLVTVRLTITDDLGHAAALEQAIEITAAPVTPPVVTPPADNGGGGGGALTPLWGLGLLLALAALWRGAQPVRAEQAVRANRSTRAGRRFTGL